MLRNILYNADQQSKASLSVNTETLKPHFQREELGPSFTEQYNGDQEDSSRFGGGASSFAPPKKISKLRKQIMYNGGDNRSSQPGMKKAREPVWSDMGANIENSSFDYRAQAVPESDDAKTRTNTDGLTLEQANNESNAYIASLRSMLGDDTFNPRKQM